MRRSLDLNVKMSMSTTLTSSTKTLLSLLSLKKEISSLSLTSKSTKNANRKTVTASKNSSTRRYLFFYLRKTSGLKSSNLTDVLKERETTLSRLSIRKSVKFNNSERNLQNLRWRETNLEMTSTQPSKKPKQT